MTSQETPDEQTPQEIYQKMREDKALEKVYQEASQWIRFANTVVWSMGTLLVPVSFGFVGVALNNSGTQFSLGGKAVLGGGSVFLFSFWVYASSFYKRSSDVARGVLMNIEEKWKLDEGGKWKLEEGGISLYKLQQPILIRRVKPFERFVSFKRFKKLYSLEVQFWLFRLQMVTLLALVAVWVLILWLKL